MKNKIIYLLCLCYIITIIYSQNRDNDPSWIYLKRAENLKEKGEYAQAIIEARKARSKFIEEKISNFYNEVRRENKDKTEYEIKKIVNQRKKDLMTDDNYPQYHELIGDLYVRTNFLEEAEKEYKKALKGKLYFDYQQKELEIKYKLAEVYEKMLNYDLEEIIYREIIDEYYKKKDKDFWNRIKYNIEKDVSLERVFRIYRIDGIEYLKALYKLGKRNCLIERYDDAIFFLANGVIVWMTYYGNLIKNNDYDFQFAGPTDFISYYNKKNKYDFFTNTNYINKIMFLIGYINFIKKNDKIKNHYFNLSLSFSYDSPDYEEIINLINYLEKNPDHKLSYKEIFN